MKKSDFMQQMYKINGNEEVGFIPRVLIINVQGLQLTTREALLRIQKVIENQ